MSATESLPHVGAVLNAANVALLLLGRWMIHRGDRERHRRFMLAAVGSGALFLGVYVTQTLTIGHGRFPGDDWVRTLYLGILATHTVLAVAVLPLVLTALTLALRDRLTAHRKLARVVFPVWLYVAVTGLVVYWMNNHLRPHGASGASAGAIQLADAHPGTFAGADRPGTDLAQLNTGLLEGGSS